MVKNILSMSLKLTFFLLYCDCIVSNTMWGLLFKNNNNNNNYTVLCQTEKKLSIALWLLN